MTPELPQSNSTPTPPIVPPEQPLLAPNSGPKRWLPLTLGALVLLVIGATAGAVGYRRLGQQPVTTAPPQPEVAVESALPVAQVEPAPTVVEQEVADTTVQAPNALNPKGIFVVMKTEVANMKTYADFEAFYLKYGSKDKIAELEKGRAQYHAMSEEQKVEWITYIKSKVQSLLLKEITTIQESISGSTATVSVRTKSDEKLIIYFVLENNQWKVKGWDGDFLEE